MESCEHSGTSIQTPGSEPSLLLHLFLCTWPWQVTLILISVLIHEMGWEKYSSHKFTIKNKRNFCMWSAWNSVRPIINVMQVFTVSLYLLFHLTASAYQWIRAQLFLMGVLYSIVGMSPWGSVGTEWLQYGWPLISFLCSSKQPWSKSLGHQKEKKKRHERVQEKLGKGGDVGPRAREKRKQISKRERG